MKRFFELIQFYVRLTLTFLWIFIASLISLSFAVVRFGNVDNNRLFGYVYGPIACFILGIKVVREGAEHLNAYQPCIYVGNHQSGIDMAVMQPLFPRNTVMIGKKEVIYVPIWGLMYFAFGNIGIDRKDKKNAVAMLDQVVEKLKEKNCSVWLMPEGTRNQSGEGLLPFKKGAFHMAIQAQRPVVPILAASLGRFVNFKTKTAKGGELRIRMLPPIHTKGMTVADVDLLTTTTREKMLVALEEMNRLSVPNR